MIGSESLTCYLRWVSNGEYESRVVAFLDILGFSKLVENADDPSWREAIEGVVLTMRNTLAPNPTMADLRFTQFSDCIVISAQSKSMWGLYGVMSGATMLADNLLQRQVLLRGGIAVGNLIHTDDVLFGPALLAAHAKDSSGGPPRICLDQSTVEAIDSYDRSFGLHDYILDDDYDLTPILHTLLKYERYTPAPAPGKEVLDQNAAYLAAAIFDHAHAAGQAAHVRAKWLWLERYWNRSVAKNGILPSTTQLKR